jgi:Zn-dependent protease with chaperone function
LGLPLQLFAVAPRTGFGPRVLPRVVVSAAPQAGQASSGSTSAPPQQAYTLPPEKLAKAQALGRIRNILGLVAPVWGLAVLYLLLATRAAAGLEAFAHRISRRRWLQGLLFFAALVVITSLADLPLDIYGHSVSLHYGISIQGWPGWSLNLAKALGLSLLFAPPVMLFFNWIVRRWPRRYWLGAWAVTLPLMLFSAFGEPFVEPIFNHYEPLAQHHPALVAQLEKVVARTGTSIPPDRMFLMKASAKSNGLNAYVSGIGSTKRIVVWDTMAERIPNDEILFLCGHETGHYVLHHIPKGLAIAAVALFFVYWACAGFAAWLARRFAARWLVDDRQQAEMRPTAAVGQGFIPGIKSSESMRPLAPEVCSPEDLPAIASWSADRAVPLSTRTGFVVLLFTVSVAGFVLAPIDNAISRHFEHEADVYGQEAIHGIVPDPQKTSVAAFNALGEAWLEDPNPNPFIEFWTYDHPSTQARATFAAHYDPWANGGHGQFFAK